MYDYELREITEKEYILLDKQINEQLTLAFPNDKKAVIVAKCAEEVPEEWVKIGREIPSWSIQALYNAKAKTDKDSKYWQVLHGLSVPTNRLKHFSRTIGRTNIKQTKLMWAMAAAGYELFIVSNQLAFPHRTQAAVTSIQNMVVECDAQSIETQIEAFNRHADWFCYLINSGNKSVHGLVHFDQAFNKNFIGYSRWKQLKRDNKPLPSIDMHEYKAVANHITNTFSQYGVNIDKPISDYSALTRLVGFPHRKTGVCASIIKANPNASFQYLKTIGQLKIKNSPKLPKEEPKEVKAVPSVCAPLYPTLYKSNRLTALQGIEQALTDGLNERGTRRKTMYSLANVADTLGWDLANCLKNCEAILNIASNTPATRGQCMEDMQRLYLNKRREVTVPSLTKMAHLVATIKRDGFRWQSAFYSELPEISRNNMTRLCKYIYNEICKYPSAAHDGRLGLYSAQMASACSGGVYKPSLQYLMDNKLLTITNEYINSRKTRRYKVNINLFLYFIGLNDKQIVYMKQGEV